MKDKWFKHIIFVALGVLLFAVSSVVQAQTEPSGTGPPPIEQQLVREGVLAIQLASVLQLGDAGDEAEAESLLADVGISPKHGWIADYPVTPVVAGELRQTVADAADAGKLPMDSDSALSEFDGMLTEAGLPMAPYAEETAGESPAAVTEDYLQPEAVHNFYSSEGPPVVTYYAPPQEYSYLYVWVPYPFWTIGYLFPGFFILHDFHRTIYVHRRPFFVSNHFRDLRTHRVFRIHPQGKLGETSHSSFGYRKHYPRSNRSGNIQQFNTQSFSRSWHRPSLTTRSPSQRNSMSSQPMKTSQPSSITSRSAGTASGATNHHFSRSRSATHSWSNRHSDGAGSAQFQRGRSSRQDFRGNRSFNRSSSHGRSFRGGHGRR